MNPQSQQSPKPTQAAATDAVEHRRLAGISFALSIGSFDEATSAQVGGTGSNSVDSITPGRIESDGSPVAVDKGQRCEGFIIRRMKHDRTSGKRYVETGFCPWANVRGLRFAE